MISLMTMRLDHVKQQLYVPISATHRCSTLDSLTHSDSGSFRRMRTALASNPNEQTTNVVALTVELLLQIFPDTSQNPTSSMQQIVQNLLNQGALGKNMIWYRHTAAVS